MINEKYTSKMCSNCGNYNENLGTNKIYNCKNCKNIIDRDINGSRCIFFKELN
jgi:transposase